ncbi:MAG: peptidoglycan DD-metalloendopeptidase family protein [Pseudohongiellaceae bacterium]
MNRWLALPALLMLAATAGRAAEAPPQERLDEVNVAIEQIETWLDEAAASLSEEEQTLRGIQRGVSEREEDIAANRQRIRELETGLRELQAEAAALDDAIEEDRELVARAVRASWMTRSDSPLKLLLNQQDPGRSSRMLQYYDAFNEARIARIEAWQDNLMALRQTREQIASSQQALNEENRALERQLTALNRDREQRQRLIDELQAGMDERGETLESLQEDRQRLETLVEEINRIIVDIPAPEEAAPFDAARGEMPWPLQGEPANRFGDSYSDGNMRRRGIIIAGETGAPVRAIHQGRVVFAEWMRGSGLLVVIDHGGGYISLYAHNGALAKRSGDWVNRGEPLATAGDDAGMDTPGVYFEIRQNGTPQDPLDWLQAP